MSAIAGALTVHDVATAEQRDAVRSALTPRELDALAALMRNHGRPGIADGAAVDADGFIFRRWSGRNTWLDYSAEVAELVRVNLAWRVASHHELTRAGHVIYQPHLAPPEWFTTPDPTND